jgi:oligopeptide/dipeptide ABC transporter ATP-binding protein
MGEEQKGATSNPMMSPNNATQPLLEIMDLKTSFVTSRGEARAVDGLSFTIKKGGTLGLVGESGCGKTVTALSIMRLLRSPPAKIHEGKILFEGRDLLKLRPRQVPSFRGKEIAMVFQEPMTALNPVYTIGNQIAEAIRQHEGCTRKELKDRTVDLLRMVGIAVPEKRVGSYPHELSGGMRQRALIAMALACKPKLLIADEPTTALDVTIQAQILDLLAELRNRLGMALLLITHDLAIVAQEVEEVLVMYAGRAVEKTTVKKLFSHPLHPYTLGLQESIPRPGKERLSSIPGAVPDPVQLPSGCRFRERCPRAAQICHSEPVLEEKEPDHWVACHRV